VEAGFKVASNFQPASSSDVLYLTTPEGYSIYINNATRSAHITMAPYGQLNLTDALPDDAAVSGRRLGDLSEETAVPTLYSRTEWHAAMEAETTAVEAPEGEYGRSLAYRRSSYSSSRRTYTTYSSPPTNIYRTTTVVATRPVVIAPRPTVVITSRPTVVVARRSPAVIVRRPPTVYRTTYSGGVSLGTYIGIAVGVVCLLSCFSAGAYRKVYYPDTFVIWT